MASKADTVILAVGFNASSESEGGDRSFELPVGQEQLIQQIAALGKKTIVVITSGGSVDVSKWKDKVQGIFETWYSGEQGGTRRSPSSRRRREPLMPSAHQLGAEADRQPQLRPLLSRPRNQQNRLPRRHLHGLPRLEHNHVEPQYPFGFGLSYTTFSFSKLKAAPAGDDRFTVTFDVTNTGKRSGATVAQLYVGESSPQVERLMLQPGETKHITLELDPRSFSYFDVKASTWQADAGTYTLELGDSSKNIQQKTTIQLPKPLMTPVSD
jgi:beta-glucosidase